MEKQQIADVFDNMGYHYFREKFAFKLWLNGILEGEDEELLVSFLEAFQFEDEDSFLFDEFMYFLRIYKKIHCPAEMPYFH
ncbi:hypothetical protein [Bacillus massilinigeriensis]|uniref:hypothetical protein n=1 Tax=Bacillus massilionigeriensis TaxID=1805475 RepID=UPI00096B5E17|nr:hypothetical protein [Bacillus massilionigeriensis]